jgi:cystathionine beta-synthase
MGYDFIPPVIERKYVDHWMKCEDATTFPMSRRLIKEEGLFCGGSSGAIVNAAVTYAKEHNLGEGVRVVCVLADHLR